MRLIQFSGCEMIMWGGELMIKMKEERPAIWKVIGIYLEGKGNIKQPFRHLIGHWGYWLTKRRSSLWILYMLDLRSIWEILGFSGDSVVKNLPAMQKMQEMWVQSLGWEDPLEEGMTTHSSILAWRIPWTEDPGGLQSLELQRVRLTEVTRHMHMRYTRYWNIYLEQINKR